MLKLFEIIEKHHKELEFEIRDAIAEYEVDPKPRIRFGGVPSHVITREYTLKIGIGKEHSYSLSIALLSGEDLRSKQVEETLQEIAENPNTQFH